MWRILSFQLRKNFFHLFCSLKASRKKNNSFLRNNCSCNTSIIKCNSYWKCSWKNYLLLQSLFFQKLSFCLYFNYYLGKIKIKNYSLAFIKSKLLNLFFKWWSFTFRWRRSIFIFILSFLGSISILIIKW